MHTMGIRGHRLPLKTRIERPPETGDEDVTSVEEEAGGNEDDFPESVDVVETDLSDSDASDLERANSAIDLA